MGEEFWRQIWGITVFQIGLAVAMIEKQQAGAIDLFALQPPELYPRSFDFFLVLLYFFSFLLIHRRKEIIHGPVVVIKPVELNILAKQKAGFPQSRLIDFLW